MMAVSFLRLTRRVTIGFVVAMMAAMYGIETLIANRIDKAIYGRCRQRFGRLVRLGSDQAMWLNYHQKRAKTSCF
jgi:hypothetical protein